MGDVQLSILIIDDEPNIRSGLEKGLQREARQVDTAENAEQGWAKFQQSHHEIVITDLRLPGEMDGLDIVQRIHDDRPETHIIVVTAHGTVETAVEAMRRGAFDFVSKPVDLDAIRHQVRRAAELFRRKEEN